MSEIKYGLLYRRRDGEVVEIASEGELWLVRLPNEGGVCLQRFIDGGVDEGYRDMDNAEGVLAITGAILGFEPSRCLRRRGRSVR